MADRKSSRRVSTRRIKTISPDSNILLNTREEDQNEKPDKHQEEIPEDVEEEEEKFNVSEWGITNKGKPCAIYHSRVYEGISYEFQRNWGRRFTCSNCKGGNVRVVINDDGSFGKDPDTLEHTCIYSSKALRTNILVRKTINDQKFLSNLTPIHPMTAYRRISEKIDSLLGDEGQKARAALALPAYESIQRTLRRKHQHARLMSEVDDIPIPRTIRIFGHHRAASRQIGATTSHWDDQPPSSDFSSSLSGPSSSRCTRGIYHSARMLIRKADHARESRNDGDGTFGDSGHIGDVDIDAEEDADDLEVVV